MEKEFEVNNFLIDNGILQYDPAKARFANETLFKLHSVIHKNLVINYYLEKGEKLDKVLNIFIRANSGGTPLSYSDLLLSIATAQWQKMDAREEITKFVDEINRIGGGFKFNKDFVLKSCLVLSDFTDIAFKVDNFNKSNMSKIEDNWTSIPEALRTSVKLVSNFGYDRETLTSNDNSPPQLPSTAVNAKFEPFLVRILKYPKPVPEACVPRLWRGYYYFSEKWDHSIRVTVSFLTYLALGPL